MTLQEIYSMLYTILPEEKVTYRAFPENEAPELPYIIYFEGPSDNMSADNQVYAPVMELNIEVYFDIEEGKDPALEALIENTLNEYGLVWAKDEEVIDSENMIEVIYTTEVIRNGRSE